ncbi:MAG TPA: hypothetical protein V6C89_11810 [Drouetiella sp.]|jgi:hypothetical protein
MSHIHVPTLNEIASDLDVCDILEISTRELKFLGLSIEPFTDCITCNLALVKAVVICILAGIPSPATES